MNFTIFDFWRIGFTSVVLFSLITHAFDDKNLESENQEFENNIDELAYSKDAPDFDATQTSSTQLQDTMTAETQNSWTNGEDLSQDSLTTETDPSQHEIIAEMNTPDTFHAGCSSVTPVDNALNGNIRILPRGNACSAETPPLVKPIPRPQTVDPVPPAIKPKPKLRTKPAKPVRRPRIPDENNPCATESRTRQTLVTCQGPEIGYTEQDADNSAYVVGCNAGWLDVTLKRNYFEPTEINDKYCCKYFEANAFYCTRITFHHTINRITTTEWYELKKGSRFHY